MRKVKSKTKKRLILFGSLSIIAIVYFSYTLVSYSYKYIKLKKEHSNLETNLINLKEEESDLKNEITKLKDPDYVAKYAMEKYFYSKDGEYVIKINEPDKKETEDKKNNDYIYYISGGFGIILIFLIIKKAIH